MGTDIPRSKKLLFSDVIVMNDLDMQALEVLAQSAQVDVQVIYAMVNEDPVSREVASSVLAALSRYIGTDGTDWTLDAVDVKLLNERRTQ